MNGTRSSEGVGADLQPSDGMALAEEAPACKAAPVVLCAAPALHEVRLRFLELPAGQPGLGLAAADWYVTWLLLQI